MLTFKSGCVELFAILGIGVKQIMKLEPGDKASSFPSLPLPSPEPSLRQLVSSWELPGENGPSNLSQAGVGGDQESRSARERLF